MHAFDSIWEWDLPSCPALSSHQPLINLLGQGEALIASSHVKSLIASGVKPADIGVISPYNMQVELIREKLRPTYPEIEISSVDGFQVMYVCMF